MNTANHMRKLTVVLLALLVLGGCRREEKPDEPGPGGWEPTPYALAIPANFPPMVIPEDNPMTVEGVKLGRHLFWETRLSGDNSMSCGSCHAPAFAFTDHGNQFSVGIQGIAGTRNTMALINLGWDNFFFWDGRETTLEGQILHPVRDPIEMHETWPNAAAKLAEDAAYRALFNQAFGSEHIDSLRVSKAIAQFLRTMISANSKFDKVMRGEAAFTLEEQLGFALTLQEGGDPALGQGGQWGADCFHCHPHAGGNFSDGQMHNNGLDAEFTDLGFGAVTGNPMDNGKFKVPTLRNVALTAPYMHDGRFATLEEVIDHYDSGGHPSPTISPFMKFTQGGLQLGPEKKAQLLAFLHTLTDMDFVNDPRFHDPGAP
jgi:cytochrome c peroxidase